MNHASYYLKHALVFAVLVAYFAADISFAQSNSKLESPVKFPDIASFIAGFMKAVVMISLPILSVAIVYSGFLFVVARGSEEGLSKAKTNFYYVIIGTILILGAWTLATLIGGTVTQLTG